jgi:leucyl-tRNA synthetase
MDKYNHKEIDKKWQDRWEADKTFKVEVDHSKEKFYGLIEFPYPSGAGLHVGHPKSNTAIDVISRKKRMQGYNVLYPIGYDAFGLPAEQYAIKTGRHPAEVTKENIANFTKQLKAIGFGFDWDRMIDTTDPSYYKWTQWIFLQFFKHGLAYTDERTVWWCEALGTVLANEEVINGLSERGDHPCIRKPLRQWMLAITKYADSLLDGLDEVDYIQKVKTQQTNWIGRSEGARVTFKVNGHDVEVFTTRPDTLFGATYMVLSPEHELVETLREEIGNFDAVTAYQKEAQAKSDLERTELQKDKTGVRLEGVTAINPVNGAEIPVFIADYVLTSYGTGAIMAVPAHDERDYEFARKYDLPIIPVVSSEGHDYEESAYTGDGKAINSDFLDGKATADAKTAIIEHLEAQEAGQKSINYKLRDWVFSRQRYWGEPFPIVWVTQEAYNKVIDAGNDDILSWLPEVPVSYEAHGIEYFALPVIPQFLPLELPEVESYNPIGTGESALASATEWVNVKMNVTTGETVSASADQEFGDEWVDARRETDTMPNWAGSSWYFLRYCDPNNDKELASQEALKYFMPVNWYNGGMEHAVLHVLYSRFWNQFLFDIGVVPYKEPYVKRTAHGMILAHDGEKMSKSKGNVVNPDEIVESVGADVLRTYIMFMGPFDQDVAWDTNGVTGIRRFIDRVYNLPKLVSADADDKKVISALHRTIKGVSEDIDTMKFNTAVAKMMEFVNLVHKIGHMSSETFMTFLQILSPFAPHLAEELWSSSHDTMISTSEWPSYDEALCVDDEITLAVQINGKVRAQVEVSADISEDELKELVLNIDNVKNYTKDGIKKFIYVKGRLVSIVV